MAIVYQWNCRTVDTYPTFTDENDNTHQDVVYNVHYRLTGTEVVDEVTYTSTNIGTANIETSDLSTFTAFESLTNENVSSWVEAVLGEDTVEAMKAGIANNIQEQQTPTSIVKYIEN